VDGSDVDGSDVFGSEVVGSEVVGSEVDVVGRCVVAGSLVVAGVESVDACVDTSAVGADGAGVVAIVVCAARAEPHPVIASAASIRPATVPSPLCRSAAGG